MLRRILPIVILILSSTFLWAQNGTISGIVTDAKTSETIIGANVVIQGTQVGSPTDLEGKFTIANVKPGTYTLVISFITYKTHLIPDVVVESGNRTDVQVNLQEDATELTEVVVTGTRQINTDVSLISAIKESKLVVSGISSEQISKLPDKDAAQIMMRVPGITIVDNRFVLIRGLPERYNQVMMNNTIAPSTEIDIRSFSFDLIPAGTIDQMLVYKSGSPELPGDFGGGVIQMITKQPAYNNYVSAGFSVGYRTNTTFKDHYHTEGSETDFLGFDNGFRDLPSGFPTTEALVGSSRNSSLRESAGKSLTNNFANSSKTAPVDFGFNLNFGKTFTIGNVQARNITSIAYSNSYQYYASEFNRYNEFVDVDQPTIRFEYVDNFYSNDVRVNLLHNWQFDVGNKTRIEFKNLFVQLGENETTLRVGDDKIQNPNFDRRNYAYHYLSRGIYTGQLQGTHELGDGTNKVSWVVGYNSINRNEPDYRRFRTNRDKVYEGTEEPFFMQLPPSGNLFETGRFWSDLQDRAYSYGASFEKKFGDPGEKKTPAIRIGFFGEQKTREFNARYLNYLYPGTSNPQIGMELIRLPLSQIFAPENIKAVDGFVIEEGTREADSYSGENSLNAGYIGGNLPLGKFDIAGGFRVEYNVQKLTAQSADGPINVDNDVLAPLPFLNIAYNLSDRSLIRAAYSRTVNRPEFRELAPFLYYQFEYEAGIIGMEDLKTAFIHNVDLRYEIYPNPGEMISVGAFYKSFKDPIESYLQVTSETPQFIFGNADKAYDVGVELEVKKTLASLGLSKFLRNTSLNLNAAWIKSEVDIGGQASNQARTRPLQGQSPYIINAGLYYNDVESGFSVNAAYNVFGARIFTVGDQLFPSWWEKPRNSLDFQIAKIFKDKYELKFNVQNALNAPYQIIQDNNNDGTLDSGEALIQRYKVGTQFSLSFNVKLINE